MTCWKCQLSIPEWQTFCSNCGARRGASEPGRTQVVRTGLIARQFNRIRGFLREQARSEEAKRLDAIFSRIHPLDDPDWAISELKRLSAQVAYHDRRLKETINFYLTMFLVQAATERRGMRPYDAYDSRRIMESIRAFRESGEWDRLDEDITMPAHSLREAASLGNPKGYSGLARLYKDLGDHGLLALYGIYPHHLAMEELSDAKFVAAFGHGIAVELGSARLGLCFRTEVPDLEYGEEIVWAYEQAHGEYQKALELHRTDASSYVELSQVLRQLGRPEEANANLHQAVAILNKAIQADNSDTKSSTERAQVFQELGEIDLAIADWQHLLTLTTREYEVKQLRDKIDRLRKKKEAAERW